MDKRAKDVADKRLDGFLDLATGFFPEMKSLGQPCGFSLSDSRWVSSEQRHSNQQAKINGDGSFELKVPYADGRELIMDILKYGGDCQVIEPKALRDRVVAEFERGLSQYSRDAHAASASPLTSELVRSLSGRIL